MESIADIIIAILSMKIFESIIIPLIKLAVTVGFYILMANYLAKRTAKEVKEALLDIQIGEPEPEE